MKKRIVSMLLAALTVLSLCTSALAAPNGQAVPGRRWRRDKQSATVSYYGPEDAGQPKYEQPPACRPTWLPEGWGLEKLMVVGEDNICVLRVYRKGGARMSFTCCLPSKVGYFGVALCDKNASPQARKSPPPVELQPLQVQGRGADFYQAGSSAYLFWEDQNGTLYSLEGDLDRASMLRMAESVKEDDRPLLPDCRLSWEPEGTKITRRDVLPGTVMLDVQKDMPGCINVPFYTFLYASEPLNVPEGTPEAVKVNGLEARYWKGIQKNRPATPWPSQEEMNTLMWTDPQTDIHFCIQGPLDKDVLLRMAESVTLKKAAPASAGAGGSRP